MGIALSAERKRQFKVLDEFYRFNEKLIINLKYGREKLNTVAAEFPYVKKVLEGGSVIEGDDGVMLADYLKGIGQTDATTQVEYLSERREALKNCRAKYVDNYKKYGSMIVKLSLMAGILFAVLLA